MTMAKRKMMTFEDFQETKRWSDDLAAAVPSENWETGAKGNLYLGRLYIEHVEPHWPDVAQEKGEWHLLLAGDGEWISNDLTSLEHRLYEWAISAGYFDTGE